MNDAERFEQIFLSQVTRPGADKLLEWLKSTDFFTAPASTRFHGAYPGGLVKLWGDRIFEKCGIRRDEEGDGGKTLEIRGKRRLSARDGGANYQQS